MNNQFQIPSFGPLVIEKPLGVNFAIKKYLHFENSCLDNEGKLTINNLEEIEVELCSHV